jgi:ubiquinone/menaquinone biosynthesis C-methylase UbiE
MNKFTQPYRINPFLRLSYSLIAPFYDAVIKYPMRKARQRSLDLLPANQSNRVLLCGVGTGLDLPLLPDLHRYTALDFSPAMLVRAKPHSDHLNIDFVLGDCMTLPFNDAQFDHVILHLIVAVVPYPELCLREASRVLKPGGTIILLDKFLQPRQHAPIRRILNEISRRIATRMDVVFEDILLYSPELNVEHNLPSLANGWFRSILLSKKVDP